MKLNAVMIIPTGLGCAIGGHAGDATPAAKLLASVCNTLILHPNVVNASDINEMPTNSMYVEGSTIDRMLQGTIRLQPPRRANHVLVAVNEANPIIINGVNAACRTIGMTAEILELRTPLDMVAEFEEDGAAGGTVTGVPELLEEVRQIQHDALAVVTPVDVPPLVGQSYFERGGINPWGGIEARTSSLIARAHDKPTAHAPYVGKDDSLANFNEIVGSRMSAEMVSRAYLFCIMKGLHQAPAIGTTGFGVDDVDILVSPEGCWGKPHDACVAKEISILMVQENVCAVYKSTQGKVEWCANYLEAAGILAAMGVGIDRQMIGKGEFVLRVRKMSRAS